MSWKVTATFVVSLVFLSSLSGRLQAIEVTWDGGDMSWDTANWNGGEDLLDLVGQYDGSNGYKGLDGEEEDFFINSGTVTYDADFLQSDFRMKQGASLTVSGGAVWQQMQNDDWAENRWTQADFSNLILDNGAFNRLGTVVDEGGGALILGSWRGDDNLDVSPEDHQITNIMITNGGSLRNEGQLWFGSWGDTAANGTVISMTIDDGTVDLTGGDVVMDEDFQDPPANADLVFSNRFVDDFDRPFYSINFVGPGSITVDSSGIVNASVDEFGDWINLDPITYEDLWDEGILQANGQSGVDGAQFGSFFSVTGDLGSDDYTLTSTIGVLAGDYNVNGELDAGDLDLQAGAMSGGQNPPEFDLNEDEKVDLADREVWVNSLKDTFFGDSNLDGEFNSGDLVAVFTAGKYDLDEQAGWNEGDWDGNLRFGSGDLIVAFQEGGYETGPRPATNAVPEPTGLALLALSWFTVSLFRRRR